MLRPCLTEFWYVLTFKQHDLSEFKRYILCFSVDKTPCDVFSYQNEMIRAIGNLIAL